MSVLVVGVTNIFASHKKLNLIDFFFIELALLLKLFNLLYAFLLVRGYFELVFVAPKHGRL